MISIHRLTWTQRLAGVERELSQIDDPAERRLIWDWATERTRRSRVCWLTATAAFIVWVIVEAYVWTYYVASLVQRFTTLHPYFAGKVWAAINLLVLSLVLFWVFQKRYKSAVRTIMNERQHPVCMNCGYNLRGQTEPRCPECGRKFDLAEISTAATSPPQSNPCRSVPRRSEPRP